MAPRAAATAPSKPPERASTSTEPTEKSVLHTNVVKKRPSLSQQRSIPPPTATTLHLTRLLDGTLQARKKVRPKKVSLEVAKMKEPSRSLNLVQRSSSGLPRATDVFGTVQGLTGIPAVSNKKTGAPSKKDLAKNQQPKPPKSIIYSSNNHHTVQKGSKRSSSDENLPTNDETKKARIASHDFQFFVHRDKTSAAKLQPPFLVPPAKANSTSLPEECSTTVQSASKPLLLSFPKHRPAAQRPRISQRQEASSLATTAGASEMSGSGQVVLPSPTCRVDRIDLSAAITAPPDQPKSTAQTSRMPQLLASMPEVPTGRLTVNAASQAIPRLMDASARQLADKFFASFKSLLTTEIAEVAPDAASPSVQRNVPTFGSVTSGNSSGGEMSRLLWFVAGVIATGIGVWMGSHWLR